MAVDSVNDLEHRAARSRPAAVALLSRRLCPSFTARSRGAPKSGSPHRSRPQPTTLAPTQQQPRTAHSKFSTAVGLPRPAYPLSLVNA
jgi:hypothetical protein